MIELFFNKEADGLHGNLIFRIPEAKVEQICDLYYAATFEGEPEPKTDPLDDLLQYWIHNAGGLRVDEIGYFPIDYSDQYVGCLKIERVDLENIKLEYGLTQKICGWAISFSDPGDFYKIVDDFEFDDRTIPIEVNRDLFLVRLEEIRVELEKNPINPSQKYQDSNDKYKHHTAVLHPAISSIFWYRILKK